ncbi:unnamed protein product [Rotaria sordida]|uniref:Non-structural maintenance of chromosomes element 1 homolog n=1 Tax=Rotaria sordida TaxID=392033 RepID=A0A819BWA6_9BILA|nr:unnamed protein product [Rotaria sordida]CAF1224347.1 unnamed protein product [Rotaria sordida]CAF3810479.1 unnamed protein product [Rotaria sordida]CAF3932949.1 unnamed protein product [Rotaria sordida]
MSISTALEDYHKQLIQYFLRDGAYNEKEMIDLLNALRDRYKLKITIKDEIRTFTNVFLPLINKHINQYGIEIKQVTSEEYENNIYFVCIQNFKPQFVKMDCSYTEKEAAVFEKLLELVITNDDKCVAPREVFEGILANDLKMTQKEFGEIMARFHRDKWIESGSDNTVILHARAILEMQSFIMDTYRDFIYNCQICTRLLIRGLICSNSSCDVHIHRSCAARYFHRLSNSTSNSTTKKTAYPCPVCKQEWNKDDVVSILKTNNVHDGNDTERSTGTIHKKQRTSKTNDHNNSINNRSIRSTHRQIRNESDDDDDDN